MFKVSGFGNRKWTATAALALLVSFGPHWAEAGQSDVSPATTPSANAPKPGEPTDPKAIKTFAAAIDWEKHNDIAAALANYRKANKQDGGRCTECLHRAYRLAYENSAYQDAADIARDWIAAAPTDEAKALVHFQLASALQQLGIATKADHCFAESCNELKAALGLRPSLALAHYSMGVSLAHLHQDQEAKAEFAAFLLEDNQLPSLHERAERFKDRVELARAVMAPPFSTTTLDGQYISMDALQGKVVLIDFWDTWCPACLEAMPHMRDIAKRFKGQPLVVLSISLDSDKGKCKEFVSKNEMTWLQARDGDSNGQLSRQFRVRAIPATFTIDADGVLEDQHVGDADIEGKLKKLIARAVEMGNRAPEPAAAAADKAPGGGQ